MNIFNLDLWYSNRKFVKKISAQFKLYFIYLVGLNSMKRELPKLNQIKKILIRINDPIGDAIVSTPIYKELKNVSPEIKVDLIASSRNKMIFENNPNINCIYIDKLKFQELLKLRNNRYDIVLDLWGRLSFAFLLQVRFINAKVNIAAATTRADAKKYFTSTKDLNFYDYIIGEDLDIHQRDRYLDFFNLFNHKMKTKRYDIYYSDKEREKAAEFLAKNIKNNIIVGINYKGSGSNNSISVEKTVSLVKKLCVEFQNVDFIIFSAPNFLHDATQIVQAVDEKNCIVTYKTESLYDFFALEDCCDLIFSTSTSALHIASALNKKIIALYPSNQEYDTFDPKTEKKFIIIRPLSKENVSEINDVEIIEAFRNLL